MVGPDRLREENSRFNLSSLNLGVEVEYGDLNENPDFKPFDWFQVSASMNLNKRTIQRGAVDMIALLTHHNFEFYILLAVVSFALLFLGPGAFAIDLPL